MHLSLDFDGTIVSNAYPEIGEVLPNAKTVINYLYDRGHEIIINSCRTGFFAENAKNYLTQKGFKFNYFNENSAKLIEKYNSDTRKISADVYIDDRDINDIILRKQLGIEEYNESSWTRRLEQFQFIEKPVIICIVGESGSGKSLAADYLSNVYDINLIESYTDRERRTPEEGGHTFLTPVEYSKLDGEVLASTVFGGNRYCCLAEDLMDTNVYVIDEVGLEMLKKNWDSIYDIHSLRVHRPDFDRLEYAGEERVNRDKDRFVMEDKEFDHIIHNNLNQKEYFYNSIEEFMSLFRLNGRALPYDINIID